MGAAKHTVRARRSPDFMYSWTFICRSCLCGRWRCSQQCLSIFSAAVNSLCECICECVCVWAEVFRTFPFTLFWGCFIKNIKKNEGFHNGCIINFIPRSPTFWGNAEQSGILRALNTNVTLMLQSWAHVRSPPPTFHTSSLYISLSLTPSALLKVLNSATTLSSYSSWLWYTVSLSVSDCSFYCFYTSRCPVRARGFNRTCVRRETCFICRLFDLSSSSIFYFSASVFPHADTSAVRSQDTPLCHTLRILFPWMTAFLRFID